MSQHDYAAQEPETYGRHHRQIVPTPRIQTFNTNEAKKAMSRQQRQQRVQVARMADQSQTHLPFRGLQVPFQSVPYTSQTQTTPQQLWSFDTNTTTNNGNINFGVSAGSDTFFGHHPPPQLETTNRDPNLGNGFDLDDEEQQELNDDPFADDPEHPPNEDSDSELPNAAVLTRTNTQITSRPIPLAPPSRKLTKRSKNGNQQQVHIANQPSISFPPVIGSTVNKENNSTYPVPLPTGKRPRALDSTDEESDHSPAPHHLPRNARDLRAQDLNPARRRILDNAIILYRARLSAVNPYPDDLTANNWAIQDWNKAQAELVENWGYTGTTDATEGELSLITKRDSQLRGEIKTIARGFITSDEHGYRLLRGSKDDISRINSNRALVALLLDNAAFVYKDPTNCNAKGTLYRHPIILAVLSTAWFGKDQHSPGLYMDRYFSDGCIPLPMIALILTAVECALDEWATGDPVCKKFYASDYEDKYKVHLSSLEGWKTYTSQPSGNNTTEKLQKQLLLDARKLAKATITGVGAASRIPFNISHFAADED